MRSLIEQIKSLTTRDWAIVCGLSSAFVLAAIPTTVFLIVPALQRDETPSHQLPVAESTVIAEDPTVTHVVTNPSDAQPADAALDKEEAAKNSLEAMGMLTKGALEDLHASPLWDEAARNMRMLGAVTGAARGGDTYHARMENLSSRLAAAKYVTEIKGLNLMQSVQAGLSGTRWLKTKDDTTFIAKLSGDGPSIYIIKTPASEADQIGARLSEEIGVFNGVLPDPAFNALADAAVQVLENFRPGKTVEWLAGGYHGHVNALRSEDDDGAVLFALLWEEIKQ